MPTCPTCQHKFGTPDELEEHEHQAHAAKWKGRINYSENGDENVRAANVGPETEDYVATNAGLDRETLAQRERAQSADRRT